jgi:hypothetical protein
MVLKFNHADGQTDAQANTVKPNMRTFHGIVSVDHSLRNTAINVAISRDMQSQTDT